jgi:hypothetical protein
MRIRKTVGEGPLPSMGPASIRLAPDSSLEGVVLSEPVSVWVFPANREKYRELQRVLLDPALDPLEKARILKVLQE